MNRSDINLMMGMIVISPGLTDPVRVGVALLFIVLALHSMSKE